MKKTLLFLGTLMLLFSAVALAQEKKVSGKVIGPDGSPVPFANVKILGTTQGTVADDNGAFIINVKPGAELEISSLGYEKTTVKPGDQASITITVKQNVKGLNEVVVTGLGTNREEKKLGYSMTEINGDAIRKANTADPTQALEGKVAGVFVSPGVGGPTASTRIIIRGVNTLQPNAQPAIFVDGVQVGDAPTGSGQWGGAKDFGNQMKNIDADDIASISVLKGAAATAIYGSKGLNGVILITTKKGSANRKLGVSFSHTEQWSHPYKFGDLQTVYGEGISDAFPTDPNTGKPQVDIGWLGLNYGPKMQGQMIEDYDGHLFKNLPYNGLDVYKDGRYVNTNVAIEGGNENTTFRFSYSNNKTSGIVFGNEFARNSFNLRATQKLGKVIDVDAGVNYVRSDAANPSRDNSGGNLIYATVYNAPRNFDFKYWNTHYIDSVHGGQYQNDQYGIVSTFWDLYQDNVEQAEDNIISHINITVHATPWLDFKAEGFGNNYFSTYQEMSRGTGPRFGGGSYTINKNTSDQYNVRGLAIAHKTTGNWDLGLTVGAENFTKKVEGLNDYTDGGLIIPDKFTLANSVHTAIAKGGLHSDYKLNSIYAFANIGWKDMLFVDLTGRNDWSSTLTYPDGHGQNSYFYPSVSASWIFTQTFHLPDFITFGKLRASYSLVGKDLDPDVIPYQNNNNLFYAFNGNYTDSHGNNFPLYGFQSGSLGNAHIKPLIAHSIEIGANMKFLNNRLGFDVDWYKKNTYNQFLSLSLPSESGVSSRDINEGNVQNKGIELLLTGSPVQTKNFSWDISFNFTRNRNMIISLAPGVTTYTLERQANEYVTDAVVGKQYGEIYTPYAYAKYQALDSKGNKIADPNNGKNVLFAYAPYGNLIGIYQRTNNYQSQGWTDVGGSQPDFYYGFHNDFSWKGLHLGISLDGKQGGKVVDYTYNYGTQTGVWTATLPGRDKASGGLPVHTFDAGGNITSTTYDGIIPNGVFQQGTNVADPLGNKHDISGMSYTDVVAKGWMQPVPAWQYYERLGSWSRGIRQIATGGDDWLSVREVSLGYDLPVSWMKRMKMYSARVSIVGRNLGYLINTRSAHLNPEALYNSNAGTAFVGSGGAPFIRDMGFNIQLGL